MGETLRTQPLLEAKDIVVEFHGKPALKGITMSVARGEVVALIGPSGSGKSTFLRCINHLQTPTSGTVSIDGVSVTEGTGKPPGARELTALRRKVGMVFQSFNLFPNMTALQNIELAQVHGLGRPRAEARKRGLALLERVGLGHRADHYPHECSGGQQQRIAIARALALDPDVLLFDEPTSALDPELGLEVLAVMREVADEGKTMVVVTHEMHFAEDVADRVVFMADGEIVEEGPAAQVMGDPQNERTRKFLRAVLERA